MGHRSSVETPNNRCYVWCARKDLNLRPLEYQSSALPTELHAQVRSLSPSELGLRSERRASKL